MSELKHQLVLNKEMSWVPCYLKSEADNVIAELEDKLQAADTHIENLINSASSIMLFQDRVNDDKCEELRRHKYKRCLAMARWCASRTFIWDIDGNEKKSEWYWKWKEHWKKLAEKFKEAK